MRAAIFGGERTKKYETTAYQLRLETACQFMKVLGYKQDDIVNIITTNDGQNHVIRKRIMGIATGILYNLRILATVGNADDPEQNVPRIIGRPILRVDLVKINSTEKLNELWSKIKEEAEKIRGQAVINDKGIIGRVVSFFLPRTEYTSLGDVRKIRLLGESLEIADSNYHQWKGYLSKALTDRPGFLRRQIRNVWNPEQSSFLSTAGGFVVTAIAINPLFALFVYEERIREVLSPVLGAMRMAGEMLFKAGSWSLQAVSLVPFAAFEVVVIPTSAVKGLWNSWAGVGLWDKIKASYEGAVQGGLDQIDLCRGIPANNNSWGEYLMKAKVPIIKVMDSCRPLAMLVGLALLGFVVLPGLGAGAGFALGSIITPAMLAAASAVASVILSVSASIVGLMLAATVLPKVSKLLLDATVLLPFAVFEAIVLPFSAVKGMYNGLMNGVGVFGTIGGVFTGAIQGCKDQFNSCSDPANLNPSVIGRYLYNIGLERAVILNDMVDSVCNKIAKILSDGEAEKRAWLGRVYPSQADLADPHKALKDLKMTDVEMANTIGQLSGRVPIHQRDENGDVRRDPLNIANNHIGEPIVANRYYNQQKRDALQNLDGRVKAQADNGDERPLFIESIVRASRDQRNDGGNYNFDQTKFVDGVLAHSNKYLVAKAR